MKRARALALLAGLALAGCGGYSEETPTFQVASAPKVQSGMTKPQVQAILGPPHHMILITSAKCTELWKYEQRGEVWGEYFTFNVGFDAGGHVCDAKMDHILRK